MNDTRQRYVTLSLREDITEVKRNNNEKVVMYLAWVNNEWLAQDKRRELIEVYTEYIAVLDAQYPSVDDLADAGMLEDYFEKRTELERLERIERCEGDSYEFALEYFSDARNPGNDGNWEGFDIPTKADAPDFHREMTEVIDDVSTVNTNAKVGIAAPRSHAKSTWFTKDFPISEVVYRKRKYIIIISETPTVAKANMEWIRNQLKFNRKLREDFGPLLSPKDQSNITDNSEEFIAWHDDGNGGKKQLALMQAASTGQALRGRNWNGARPDLIICDDLEDARPGGNASTPEQRAKLRDWFAQTVMSLGDPKGKRTAFVVVGTTVHMSSLLMQILHERADFNTRIYRAIIDEPKRMDLWETCRLLYVDRNDPNRATTARSFFDANKDAMLEGVRVLWPEVQSIWTLMTWKWNNGSKAFNTEYMNNPIDEESQVFNPETFTYYEGDIDVLNDRYEVANGVDLALGKQRGDYSAIATTAKDKSTGVIYVADMYGQRVKPDEFIRENVANVLRNQPTVIAAEAVAAQEFFVDELKKALTKVGYPSETRVKKIYNRTRKELRIEALLPMIENGTIQFSRKHSLLLEQFERYGTGENDDCIDALEMAISALADNAVAVTTVRRNDRWSTSGSNQMNRRR